MQTTQTERGFLFSGASQATRSQSVAAIVRSIGLFHFENGIINPYCVRLRLWNEIVKGPDSDVRNASQERKHRLLASGQGQGMGRSVLFAWNDLYRNISTTDN